MNSATYAGDSRIILVRNGGAFPLKLGLYRGGVDMVVFTGGIGENDEAARAMICGGLSWAGLGQPEMRSWTGCDSVPGSRACILPSREDEQIARHPWSLRNATGG